MYTDWLKAEHFGPLSFIRGGSADRIARETLASAPLPFVFLADRSSATTLAALISMRPGRRVELRMSRGLEQDLEAAALGRDSSPILMHGQLFRREVVLEVRRLASAMQVVSSYATPIPIVEDIMMLRLKTMLETYANRSFAPLIIHDDAMIVPPALAEAHFALEIGGPEPFELETLDGLLANGQQPASSDVVKHAEFLARCEWPALIRMHEFLKGPCIAPAIEHWRRSLRSASRYPGYELYVQLGLERLEELEAALTAQA